MTKEKSIIRLATERDANQLLEIYAPYVKNTAITFEYSVPSIQEFSSRIQNVLKKYPFIVAEIEGKIAGYAYGNTFQERAAYDWTAETTVYVRQDKTKLGLGKELYNALEKTLAAQNIIKLYACIAYSENDDEYLNHNSLEFHQHLGYRVVGKFQDCGYKFNRWYNMAWLEKQIGTPSENQPPFIHFPFLQSYHKEKRN